METPVEPQLSRRTVNVSLAALPVAALLGQQTYPQVVDPRPPLVDASDPQQVADGVWVLRDHRVWLVPNIGIIVGRDAALVVDCGLGPANGERVLDVARRLAGRRRLVLTLTHFHPEHGYGAQVFRPDATILYNRTQRDEFERKGAFYLDRFRERQSANVVRALNGTNLVMPHIAYEGGRHRIDLGGRTVELHNWGAGHTLGDQVVFLPKERILFVGDLIEERMFPIFPWAPPEDADVDAAGWMRALARFANLNPKLVVPGHGDPGDIGIALDLSRYIAAVGRDVRALRLQAQEKSEIIARLKPRIIADHPGWEHAFLIDAHIEYLCSLPT